MEDESLRKKYTPFTDFLSSIRVHCSLGGRCPRSAEPEDQLLERRVQESAADDVGEPGGEAAARGDGSAAEGDQGRRQSE